MKYTDAHSLHFQNNKNNLLKAAISNICMKVLHLHGTEGKNVHTELKSTEMVYTNNLKGGVAH